MNLNGNYDFIRISIHIPEFLVHCHSLQVFPLRCQKVSLESCPEHDSAIKQDQCYLYHIIELVPDDNQSSSQQFIANLFNAMWKILKNVHHHSDKNSAPTWTIFDKHRINSHSNRKKSWEMRSICIVCGHRKGVHREWSEEIFQANTFREGGLVKEFLRKIFCCGWR